MKTTKKTGQDTCPRVIKQTITTKLGSGTAGKVVRTKSAFQVVQTQKLPWMSLLTHLPISTCWDCKEILLQG